MPAAPVLLETQRQFLAALFDDAEGGPVASITGNGLDPAARLRIYRRSCNEIQTSALRTTYPAVLALVGETFFDQAAYGYRRAYPSRSGNLQAFGEYFGDYLESLPAAAGLRYLPDVARLEWLRQESALAAEDESASLNESGCAPVGVGGPTRTVLDPSVRLLASPHAVLTIWGYAAHPTPERLKLPEFGERVMLWREDDQVVMAALNVASFACVDVLAHRGSLDDAFAAGRAQDSDFDFAA